MVHGLKVLHVIGGGEFGGAEQHILSLMDQYTDHGINATVVTFYDSIFAQKLRDAGHSVRTIERFGRFDLRLLTALIRILYELQPDIVHTHGVRANFFARLAAKRAQVKTIVTTVHSILRLDYPKSFAYLIAKWMERSTQSITSHFIAVSEDIKMSLLDHKIDKNKITLIQNGIDTTIYNPTPTIKERAMELRKTLNIHREDFVIGTNARLVSVKGLQYLIEGFAKALQQDSSLQLFIAGNGPEKERLLQLIHQHQLENKISLVGFRKDIATCLAAMDLYINCSLSEGTPISVMEAMAAEKPLILTSVGGMKDMVIDEVSAVMIPAQSADAIASGILRLKQDPLLRTQLAHAAKETVEEKYTVEIMTQQQIHVYQHLLEGK